MNYDPNKAIRQALMVARRQAAYGGQQSYPGYRPINPLTGLPEDEGVQVVGSSDARPIGGGISDGGNDPGTPGPPGAPSTGNFGRDVAGFAEAAGPALGGMAIGGLMGGPAGAVMGGVASTMAQGLAEATGLSNPASAPPGGFASVAGNIAQTQMGMQPTSNPVDAVTAAVTGPQSPADQEDADQGNAQAAADAAAAAAAAADNANSMSEAATADASADSDGGSNGDSGDAGGDGDGGGGGGFARGGDVKGGTDPRSLPGIHLKTNHRFADGGGVQPEEEEGFDAYHGSPHEFEQFDSSKIGTGEGAQAFGYGHYLAENEGVARSYRDKLTRDKLTKISDDKLTPVGRRNFNAAVKAAMEEYSTRYGVSIRSAREQERLSGFFSDKVKLDAPREWYQLGHMYHVRVKAKPEHFLDWDAPLGEQHPQVVQALDQTFPSAMDYWRSVEGKAGDNGGHFHAVAAEDLSGNTKKGHEQIASKLQAAGIPGIKYFDRASRSAGEGTRNYVIFDPNMIQVKRRYADGGEIMPQRDLGADPAVQRALDLTRNNDVSPVAAARSVALGETYGGQNAPAYSEAGTEAGRLPIGRNVSGSEGILPSSHQAPLEGLPTRVKVPLTGEVITAGPNHQVRAIAEQYMRDAGLPYNPPRKYAKVDPDRGKRIADEYTRMSDDADHPLVKAAYDAMVKETMAQYRAAKAGGLKLEFWNPDKEKDPYEASPRLAIEDVNKNHHMYIFPTNFGFGEKEISPEDIRRNPLLADSGERWNGIPVTVNDLFRAVHDYFGHAKEGVGFRGDGEENAWRSHAAMYSPLARLALTSETRGQNSWLNYGPHGEKNRNARTEDTVFADQKVGVMPPWTTHEGAEDFIRPEDREAMEKAYRQYRKARGGSIGYADGGMPGDDPTVQRAMDLTRQAQPSAPQVAAAVQPQAMPIADPSSTINQYRGTGLSFPEKDNAARLALKAKRENLLAQGKAAGNPANPRMVIRAPEAADGEKQLPDFVVGQLNHKDWTDRHEAILSPSEIHQSSQWYKRVKNTFDTFYPNDPELSKTMMRAWLVAQQNVSPAGAMNNVLMQREQMLRGDPEETWQAGGMPMPTQAARSVLRQQPIEMGVGQKIADFVDSAEGKPVRSWMGNHPDGGAPFVVDVHTARDTGMVDEELLNHLRRLGYDQDDLSNVKIDLKGSPTEAAYENRGQWGRGLTKHLNSIKWQGKSDWTPDEIQAVGWMGMTKLTRNAEEDSESGLSRNLRRLSFETAPGEGSPWEKKYGQAFSSLSPEQQRDVTHAINEEALKRVAELSGIDVRHVVHGTGAWEKTQSPATVGQALMTQKGGDIAANALGYLLNQTEVWHNRAKPLGGTKNPSGFAIDFIQKNGRELADPAYLQDLWQKITDADPHDIIKGYQPIKLPTGEVGIRAIITKGGEKTKGLIEGLIGQGGSVRRVIEASPHDLEVMGHEAEVSRAVNDWKENPNGEAYMERLVNLLGPNSRAKLADIRTQLEKRLETHLNEIGSGKSQQGRKSTGKQKAQLEKASGGFVSKNPDLLNRALRLTAPDRPMVALADLFQRQLRGRPPS